MQWYDVAYIAVDKTYNELYLPIKYYLYIL